MEDKEIERRFNIWGDQHGTLVVHVNRMDKRLKHLEKILHGFVESLQKEEGIGK